ncbi:hypothetical protein [Serinicoccus sediminis]|uniref:hypothetical protein n=1 Tax=Serinicoccus sediminis TaxID=2306021 RepID=UPI00101F0AE1|nr:hypothetical protein [Serinicoccus sediminis]
MTATLQSNGTGPLSDLVTRFDFVLPRGYLDQHGEVHREGVMRLATARDEILPLRDPRVRDNEAYLAVVLLSRVVERVGTVSEVTPGVVESLFAGDLEYLQDLYRTLNRNEHSTVVVRCPGCDQEFAVDTAADAPGES